MQFIPTSIPDVILVEPKVIGDHRGFFFEVYQEDQFRQGGIPDHFIQDNHSGSQQNTLRGLHYQIRYAQGKLVRVVAGEIFDVAVDIRRSSPTFGKWVGMHLSVENRRQFWVPPGFAHGFFVVSEWAEVVYKVTDVYAPEWERTIAWNDADIGVQWPVPPGVQPLLSQKDLNGIPFHQADLFD
jgi:dTDP-4-dehydrorhamnose 3,5-epimerase